MFAVIHDIASNQTAHPYLDFAPGAAIQVKIAGGELAQPSGDAISVTGLSEVLMRVGQDSSGNNAPARTCQGRLVNDAGSDVTAKIVCGPCLVKFSPIHHAFRWIARRLQAKTRAVARVQRT